MANNPALLAYEDRYQRVFSAGALHWNDPKPNQHLAQILPQLHPCSNCIEFGCGEGYQERFIASKGHSVTAIDISHTAIAKAKKESPSHLKIRFVVGDVTDGDALNLPPESFHFAWNISCLHMMAEEEDRKAHLELVKRILLPEGLLFSQNGLDLDDVQPGSDSEAKEIDRMKELREKPHNTYMAPNCQGTHLSLALKIDCQEKIDLSGS